MVAHSVLRASYAIYQVLLPNVKLDSTNST